MKENSWVGLSNPTLMELHCTWPHVCMFTCLLICLLGLTTPLYISNEHFQALHKKWMSMSSDVRRTWCHFKVTNNAYWWHFKGKNRRYKLQEWLYGLSSNGLIVLWLSEFEFWRRLCCTCRNTWKNAYPLFDNFKVLCLWATSTYPFARLRYTTEVQFMI